MGLDSWISCYEVGNCDETEIAYFLNQFNNLHTFFIFFKNNG